MDSSIVWTFGFRSFWVPRVGSILLSVYHLLFFKPSVVHTLGLLWFSQLSIYAPISLSKCSPLCSPQFSSQFKSINFFLFSVNVALNINGTLSLAYLIVKFIAVVWYFTCMPAMPKRFRLTQILKAVVLSSSTIKILYYILSITKSFKNAYGSHLMLRYFHQPWRSFEPSRKLSVLPNANSV